MEMTGHKTLHYFWCKRVATKRLEIWISPLSPSAKIHISLTSRQEPPKCVDSKTKYMQTCCQNEKHNHVIWLEFMFFLLTVPPKERQAKINPKCCKSICCSVSFQTHLQRTSPVKIPGDLHLHVQQRGSVIWVCTSQRGSLYSSITCRDPSRPQESSYIWKHTRPLINNKSVVMLLLHSLIRQSGDAFKCCGENCCPRAALSIWSSSTKDVMLDYVQYMMRRGRKDVSLNRQDQLCLSSLI